LLLQAAPLKESVVTLIVEYSFNTCKTVNMIMPVRFFLSAHFLGFFSGGDYFFAPKKVGFTCFFFPDCGEAVVSSQGHSRSHSPASPR
jgi:hypothetical protein